MALVTNVVETVNIPNESETAVIRKLSHVQLREASKKRQSEGLGFMKEMGGELLKSLRESDANQVQKIQETQEAVISNYDRDILLQYGVVSWSYPAPLPDGLNQLDETTAKFLAEKIFELGRPATKVEAKNV